MKFPDPSRSREPNGIIAVGGDLTVETLLEAYRAGIFPWPMQGIRYCGFRRLSEQSYDSIECTCQEHSNA